ncbi:GDSL esterase/lipase At1g71250-like [Magnolia sinica]|uniref:GDSL esterase/lipase At1g71250-like n=1 Tax=Magnolia sinica TaxID=86752 RepID=UPI002658B357|nr:GDSL esterase/lipase At1g71250-like [Magnolia sinica]
MFRKVMAMFVLVFLLLLRVVADSVTAPAVFVFGDSLSDSGNNNYIPTLAKSNYSPYGIDFPLGPTGRFSNGKLAVDIIAELLGLPFAPPFSDPSISGVRILQGINYASGASGILDETGQQFAARIPLKKQIENFRQSLSGIYSLFSQNTTLISAYMSKALFLISTGSNDYLTNYLRPDLYATSSHYTPLAFSDLLVRQMGQQLMALYNMGARKFVVYSVGPIGCTPVQLSGQSCTEKVNQMVVLFNSALRSFLIDANMHMPGTNFVYVDAYGIVTDVLINPNIYGFIVTGQGCCGVDKSQGQVNCIVGTIPCSDRNSYTFWDGLHPTEALNRIVAQRSFTGPPSDIYPINIQQLASI